MTTPTGSSTSVPRSAPPAPVTTHSRSDATAAAMRAAGQASKIDTKLNETHEAAMKVLHSTVHSEGPDAVIHSSRTDSGLKVSTAAQRAAEKAAQSAKSDRAEKAEKIAKATEKAEKAAKAASKADSAAAKADRAASKADKISRSRPR